MGGRLNDDLLQPFRIGCSRIRGHLVRLGPVSDDILSRHAYPPAVATLLGEALALAAVLAAGLKYDGIFSLQASGDGPLGLMVVDITSEGDLRGYARCDAEGVAAALVALPAGSEWPPVPVLLGKGYLSFTVDQGPETERYQGLVALEGETLSACANHYFQQSEQIPTAVRLAAAPVGSGAAATWRAGAIAIQRLPEDPPEVSLRKFAAGDGGGEALSPQTLDALWEKSEIFLASCRKRELLTPDLPHKGLLLRLFGEENVYVSDPRPLCHRCRCSEMRVIHVLRSLSLEELAELRQDDEVIKVTCEFCKRDYVFDDRRLTEIRAASKDAGRPAEGETGQAS